MAVKRMTYIAFLEDADGQQVNFERFACRHAATVKSMMLKLWSSSLYRACTKSAETVKVYKSNDGYHYDDTPVIAFALPIN